MSTSCSKINRLRIIFNIWLGPIAFPEFNENSILPVFIIMFLFDVNKFKVAWVLKSVIFAIVCVCVVSDFAFNLFVKSVLIIFPGIVVFPCASNNVNVLSMLI